MSSARRNAVAMDDTEVSALLADNLKVQVASIGPDGAPHLSTLFYVVRDGLIAFWTYGASQKVRNLERDPRVGALVEDGVEYAELRGVSITGRAEVVRDLDVVREVGGAVAARMAGVDHLDELGELGHTVVDRQAPKRVAVLVHPVRVATWDHRKLA